MKVKIFGDLDNITNKRGTNELVLKFITQEVSDESAGLVMKLRNKYVCLLLSTSDVTDEEANKELDDDFKAPPILESKRPSQRLRAVLYRQWESRYQQRYPDFNNYYDYKMELIIEEEKEKI